MTTTPRKFDSEIKITNSGIWLHSGHEISQKDVLNFFKRSIKEDKLGIYIQNSYGELEENGYIQAETIFLNIINVDLKEEVPQFETEDDTVLPIFEFHFYSDSNEKIFCMRKTDHFIKFRFNRKSHNFISNLMIEENGDYFLETNGKKIPVLPFNKKIDVDLPEIYKKKNL